MKNATVQPYMAAEHVSHAITAIVSINHPFRLGARYFDRTAPGVAAGSPGEGPVWGHFRSALSLPRVMDSISNCRPRGRPRCFHRLTVDRSTPSAAARAVCDPQCSIAWSTVMAK